MSRSKMFQPHRKKSLDKAISLTIHSKVKMDVKTCGRGRRNAIVFHLRTMGIHNLIAHIEGIAEALAHPVVFHGQKSGVQHYAQGNGQFEQRIPDHFVQAVLELEPALVVSAAMNAAVTVSIRKIIWWEI